MAELFDTHAHFEGTAEEIAATLARAAGAGVTQVMAIGGSAALNAGARLAATGRENVRMALGWDRESIGADQPDIDYAGVTAVGELGLDYFYGPDTREEQLALFSRQLELARRLGKSAVIHTREADDDTLGALREIRPKGIIHCFTGGVPFCRALLDLGYYISISGIVTFRRAENVREAARFVPDDRLLVETDSPFLAPVPMRGQANEPAFVAYTAKFLAELRGTTFEALAALTTANAERCLGVNPITPTTGEKT